MLSYKGVLHDISSVRLQDLFKLIDVIVLVGTANKEHHRESCDPIASITRQGVA